MRSVKQLIIFMVLSPIFFGCVLFDSRSFLENKKTTATETEKKMIDEAISQLPQNSAIVLNPLSEKKSEEIKNESVVSKLKYVNVIFSCEKKSFNDSIRYFANKKVQWLAKSNTVSYKGVIFIDETGSIQLPLDVYRPWELKLNISGMVDSIDLNVNGVDNKANILCP